MRDELILVSATAAAGAVAAGVYKGGMNVAKSLDRHHRVFGGKLTDEKALESIKKALSAAETLIDYKASADVDDKKLRKLEEKVSERNTKMDRRVNRQVNRIDKMIRKYRDVIDDLNKIYDQVNESPNQKRRKKAVGKVERKIAKAQRAKEELQNGVLHVHALTAPSVYGGPPDPDQILANASYKEADLRAWMNEATAAKRHADNVWLTDKSLVKWESLEDFSVGMVVTIIWANAQKVEVVNGSKTGSDFQKQCDGFWSWLSSDKWATQNVGGKQAVWSSADRKMMVWTKNMSAPSDPGKWFDRACDQDDVVLYNKLLWYQTTTGTHVIGYFFDDSLESAHALIESLRIANGGEPASEYVWAAEQIFAGNPPPVLGNY